jgi:2-(1,2-epoxy-1,2-dihydrophenyl)acetyl-CoA isomerase
MSDNLLLNRDEGVAVLTLNRPDSLNSLSLQAVKDLLSTLRTLHVDESVRAMLVTGAGRGFCAGWQLEEGGVPGLPDESFGVRQAHLMAEYFNPVIQAFHDLPFPVVAAVNGPCAGAGVSIALSADIVLAAESAYFMLTFSPRLGLIPDLGATWKLPRLIGWARAQAATLLGDKMSATDAAASGMIWRCLPDASLIAEATAVVSRLAKGPPGIAREVRHAYHASSTNTLAEQLDYERHRQRELLDSAAFNEGLKAFAEKRSPDFYKT